MNIQKLVAIVAAVAINVVVLAALHAWTANVAAGAAAAARQTEPAITLPTITVRPTPAQIEQLRQARRPDQASRLVPAETGAGVGGGADIGLGAGAGAVDGSGTGTTATAGVDAIQTLVMPYYSFAAPSDAAARG